MNHSEGSLVRALTVLADHKVNLTRIESRPLPDTPWEYLFFVDVEGHTGAPNLAEALRDLRTCCTHLRLMGSYPSRTRKQDAHLDRAAFAAPEPAAPEAPRALSPLRSQNLKKSDEGSGNNCGRF